LRHLAEWQRARQSHAAEYNRLFSQIPASCRRSRRKDSNTSTTSTHSRGKRDALQKFLSERKNWKPVYILTHCIFQPLLEARPQAGDFRAAERAAQEVLSLPMYPELRKEQIARVVKTIAEFLKC